MALANVRGSGVYGEPWRLAGFKATKPNTWKDGIACAQYLIAQGYASPQTLGVHGHQRRRHLRRPRGHRPRRSCSPRRSSTSA